MLGSRCVPAGAALLNSGHLRAESASLPWAAVPMFWAAGCRGAPTGSRASWLAIPAVTRLLPLRPRATRAASARLPVSGSLRPAALEFVLRSGTLGFALRTWAALARRSGAVPF